MFQDSLNKDWGRVSGYSILPWTPKVVPLDFWGPYGSMRAILGVYSGEPLGAQPYVGVRVFILDSGVGVVRRLV